MKIKTSELTGAALDWAVAKCEGNIYHGPAWTKYSTNWAQGGPIIEREGICIGRTAGGVAWDAIHPNADDIMFRAYTPLIAAMRCYVASKLGSEVEIPQELLA